ncbi:YraN family protein [Pedobacter sp. SYSU D00535]|uniref:YraN family protein n=1 Tax=Pedobacter sp. SYSU D00535 TaxID=2810308 RepID=UPI001A960472|nr:YraN family protein [Pedobacter sp. SYSU D00535]
MASHNQLGIKGERLAKEYLEAAGYEILDENWCHGKAEVDLIAYRDRRIVFVEVKTRSSTNFGEPEDFVTEAKQKNLQKAAEEYIYVMNFKGEIRFDIISIIFNKVGEHKLHHIEDAFW